MPTQAVHVRNPRSLGAGWNLKDLIILPVWLLTLIELGKWLWNNLLEAFLSFLLLVFIVISFIDWQTALAYGIGLIFILGLFIYADAYWRFDGIRTFSSLSKCIYWKYKIKYCWERLMKAAEVKLPNYPSPKRIRYTKDTIYLKINTSKILKTSGDFAVNAPEMAAAIDAMEIKVDTPRPARAELQISFGNPTSKEIRPGDVIQTTKVNTVAPVNDIHGVPIDIPIDSPLLVVGEVNSGKSTLLWNFLEVLNKKKIPYRIRAVDPKGGVELSNLQDGIYTIDYINSPNEIDAFLARADAQLTLDLERMKRKGIRNAPVSKEFPLDLMVIDEFLTLTQYDEQSPIGKRLIMGRAPNHSTVALSQLSQIDVLGRVRDLFPIRMCLATSSSGMTNAALGDDAEKSGAKCSKIDTPGVGFMYKDGISGFVKFRAANIYDDETEIIAQGGIIEATTQFFSKKKLPALGLRKTSVYKFYNSEGRLLYVGMAWNFEKRRKQHAGLGPEPMKKWWPEVDESETVVTEYSNRKLARKAELWSIKHENPRENIADKV